VPSLIFRKGLELKGAVAGMLADSYLAVSSTPSKRPTSRIAGRLTIRLAREFGFCYGVDRAVDRLSDASGSPRARSISPARSSITRTSTNSSREASVSPTQVKASSASRATTSSSCLRSA
jgi:hypothetical protein